MSVKFRGVFVAKLRKLIPELEQELYDKLFKMKWVVYAKTPFGKPENVIAYLGRYTHKIAISNHRIININKQKKTVTFRVKDYRKNGQTSILKLTTKEFIRRFQLHILPKGFTRIRHYGILSSTWKKEKLPRLQLLLTNKEIDTIAIHIDTEKSLHKVCPSCKKARVITLLNFDSRGPPKDYLKIAKRKIKKYKN